MADKGEQNLFTVVAVRDGGARTLAGGKPVGWVFVELRSMGGHVQVVLVGPCSWALDGGR